MQCGKPHNSYPNRCMVYGHRSGSRFLEKVVGIKEPAVLEIFEGIGCCVSKNNFKFITNPILITTCINSLAYISFVINIFVASQKIFDNCHQN